MSEQTATTGSAFGAVGEVFKTQAGFLVFRNVRPNVAAHPVAYLAYTFAVTALVGAGRYWDNPRAELWQNLGLGSVVYILILAAVLWLLILPLEPESWSYPGVLVFVGLTALPGLLYAIPVERFLEMRTAQAVNVWFLAIVALWRVALLVAYLVRSAKLRFFEIALATLLPITLIIATLAILNLEHVVFNIMAGIPPDQVTGNDSAYLFVLGLGMLSLYGLPVVLIFYIVAVAAKKLR